MILGNSKRQNLGKKYLIRKKLDYGNITDCQLGKAANFNQWFVANKCVLEQELSIKNIYDEDVFMDTYIRMAESIIFTDSMIQNFKSYFCRSYYTNYINQRSIGNRFINNEYDLSLIEDDSDTIIQTKIDMENKIEQILEFVRTEYPNHLEIFKLNMVDSLNYNEVSKRTGIQSYVIQKNISLIKKDLTKRFGCHFSGNSKFKKKELSDETKAQNKPQSKDVDEPDSDRILRLIDEKKVVPYSMYSEQLTIVTELKVQLAALKNSLQTILNNYDK